MQLSLCCMPVKDRGSWALNHKSHPPQKPPPPRLGPLATTTLSGSSISTSAPPPLVFMLPMHTLKPFIPTGASDWTLAHGHLTPLGGVIVATISEIDPGKVMDANYSQNCTSHDQ